jgi:hypothetical protein
LSENNDDGEKYSGIVFSMVLAKIISITFLFSGRKVSYQNNSSPPKTISLPSLPTAQLVPDELPPLPLDLSDGFHH